MCVYTTQQHCYGKLFFLNFAHVAVLSRKQTSSLSSFSLGLDFSNSVYKHHRIPKFPFGGFDQFAFSVRQGSFLYFHFRGEEEGGGKPTGWMLWYYYNN